MTSPVCRAAQGGYRQGRLTADLAWRGDRWLVVGLSIERVQ
ncbi:hypothetical protein [Thermomonas sp.]|nr:hypothetical protein [Thermomonas sp.]